MFMALPTYVLAARSQGFGRAAAVWQAQLEVRNIRSVRCAIVPRIECIAFVSI